MTISTLQACRSKRIDLARAAMRRARRMAETIEFRGDEHIDLAASRVWRYASEVRTRVALHLYGVRE